MQENEGWSSGIRNSVRTEAKPASETNALMLPTLKSEVCFCLLFPFCLVCKLIWSIIFFVSFKNKCFKIRKEAVNCYRKAYKALLITVVHTY